MLVKSERAFFLHIWDENGILRKRQYQVWKFEAPLNREALPHCSSNFYDNSSTGTHKQMISFEEKLNELESYTEVKWEIPVRKNKMKNMRM